MTSYRRLKSGRARLWDDEKTIRPPQENDKRRCPECEGLCTWVNMGNSEEGAFWSCDCGYESTQEELCALHWVNITECGCTGSLENSATEPPQKKIVSYCEKQLGSIEEWEEHFFQCSVCLTTVPELQELLEQVIVTARWDVLRALPLSESEQQRVFAGLGRCRHCGLELLGKRVACASCAVFYKVRSDGTTKD